MSSYFPGGSDSKEFACNAEEFACNAGEFAGMECLIPELGRCPGEEHGDSLLYSCLENPHGLRCLVCYSPWDLRLRHD